MKYFKNIDGNYIVSISTTSGNVEITKEEYDNILLIIKTRPSDEDGFIYKLCTDLIWEQIKNETIYKDEEEIDAEEALNIIIGGVI